MKPRPCIMMALCCTFVLGSLLVGGCDGIRFKGPAGSDPPSGAQADPQPAAAWPFAPVSMRIHPFTAIEFDESRDVAVLNARVELLDQVGDMTKGVGQFRFELYQVGRGAGSDTQQRQLYAWQVPLQTIDQNRLHYDHITRTYGFELKMDQMPQAGTALRLVGQFTTPSGRRLSADAPLTGPTQQN